MEVISVNSENDYRCKKRIRETKKKARPGKINLYSIIASII